MQADFDDFDRGILRERIYHRGRLNGILVGDIIYHSETRKYARVTDTTWIKAEDGGRIQTSHWYDTLEHAQQHGSFHLSESGNMSYSGSLEPGIEVERLVKSERWRGRYDANLDKVAQVRAWIFHHGYVTGHNGVDVMVPVTIWVYAALADIVKSSTGWIIEKGQFKGNAYTSTYTTLDGVERVSFSDNQPLPEYLEQNPNLEYKTDEEFSQMLRDHHNSMVTQPTQVTKDHWWEMLEVLPPCRWGTIGGVEMFHVSERLTGDLVNWFGRLGKIYLSCTDYAGAQIDEMAKKFADAAKGKEPLEEPLAETEED